MKKNGTHGILKIMFSITVANGVIFYDLSIKKYLCYIQLKTDGIFAPLANETVFVIVQTQIIFRKERWNAVAAIYTCEI